MTRDDLPVITCYACREDGCIKCMGTGKLFWASGRSFPYSPEGETRALAFLKRDMEAGR
jgi:hypothetical protein